LHVIEATGAATGTEFTFSPDQLAAVALDAARDRLIVVYDRALGSVLRLDLASGVTDTETGIFVDGFIESL
jgi:hypothetical protein